MLNLRPQAIATWTAGKHQGADVSHKFGLDRHAQRSPKASCSSPCAASVMMLTIFSLRRHRAGAVAALVERPLDSELPQVIVADTQLALGRIAAEVRRQHAFCVIGITGSNGKTTVKSLTRRDPRAACANPLQYRQLQ